MNDIQTIFGAVGVSWASRKLLGPSLDMYGQMLKDWQSKRIYRVQEILKRTKEITGDTNGLVSERVAFKILNDGSLSDDKILINYYAGVLASSKSDDINDDRGTYWVNLVSNLSSYQIKFHYLVYSTLVDQLKGHEVISLGLEDKRKVVAKLFMNLDYVVSALGLVEKDYHGIIRHTVGGLVSYQLLENDWAAGHGQHLSESQGVPEIQEDGMIVTGSMPGFEFFLWAVGKGKQPLEAIFSPNFEYLKSDSITPTGSARRIEDINKLKN